MKAGKLSNKKLNFVIDYALCYLFASWDDHIEADLGMSYEEFVKVLGKYHNNKIKVEQYPNE
jgi:hypothetical protein